AVSQKRIVFIAGLVLALIAVIIRWTSHFLDLFSLAAVNNIVSVLFLGFTIVIILNYLFSEKRITADTIMGAICVYFLMGLMWAMGYSLLEMFEPGSFQIPPSMDIAGPDFGYYSYVTLTTLGYGDITPISGPAQSLSTLEAAMGQLYLAVLVARLVGVHISQSHRGRSE
ncbi:ion channel, partial [bacterium]|nr:ion channel [bacterium]